MCFYASVFTFSPLFLPLSLSLLPPPSPPLPLSLGSVESVNDGIFHTVELLIQNQTLSLVVDKGSPKSLGKLSRQPSVDHNTQLFVGWLCVYGVFDIS